MIPIFILQTWLLGLLSLGVGWDPELKQWVFSPNFGSNEETMLFAVAIILTLIALAGGTIVKGVLRLTSRGKRDADADPRTAPNATSQQRLRRPDGSELQIEFYGPRMALRSSSLTAGAWTAVNGITSNETFRTGFD